MTRLLPALVILVLAAAAALALQAPNALTRGPLGVAFYTPPSRLPGGPHGTLIWERPDTGPAALPGATSTLLLYTQVGVRGGLVATSGDVAVPYGHPPAGGWPVIAWAHGSTGLADQCAPTRSVNPEGAVVTDPLLERWLADGYAIVRTDYEGLGTPGGHPYLIGASEGRAVLDAVRAARHADAQLSARVIIAGHSQGGHAALWATALARTYTPDLRVAGTIAFAPASHTSDLLGALRSISSTALTSTAASLLRGLDLADPALHARSLLTAAGARLWPQTLTRCQAALDGTDSFGALPTDRLVRSSADLGPVLTRARAQEPMGLRIPGPVLIEQGLSDANVSPDGDRELAASLRAVGDAVSYRTYVGATHDTVIAAATPDATAFLRAHLAR